MREPVAEITCLLALEFPPRRSRNSLKSRRRNRATALLAPVRRLLRLFPSHPRRRNATGPSPRRRLSICRIKRLRTARASSVPRTFPVPNQTYSTLPGDEFFSSHGTMRALTTERCGRAPIRLVLLNAVHTPKIPVRIRHRIWRASGTTQGRGARF